MRDALRKAALGGGILGLTLAATPAFADRVDGEWCDPAGRHILIQGPTIVTPSGAKAQGVNRRHSFEYQAPAGDTPAGAVRFRQFNDDLMEAVSDDAAKPVEWRRCKPIS
jgi:hypothetical protein